MRMAPLFPEAPGCCQTDPFPLSATRPAYPEGIATAGPLLGAMKLGELGIGEPGGLLVVPVLPIGGVSPAGEPGSGPSTATASRVIAAAGPGAIGPSLGVSQGALS